MVCLCKWNKSSSPESVACVGTQVIIAPERLQALIDAWASNDASELHDKFQVKSRTRPRVSESLYSATDLDYTRRLVLLGGQVVSVAISDAVGQSLLELEEGKEQVRVAREAGGSGEMEASGSRSSGFGSVAMPRLRQPGRLPCCRLMMVVWLCRSCRSGRGAERAVGEGREGGPDRQEVGCESLLTSWKASVPPAAPSIPCRRVLD